MSIRQEKIANVIKKELGVFFQKNAASICQGAMVSVTMVRMSPDLSIAKIYLSIFGGKNNDDLMDEFGDLKIKSSNCEVNKNKNIIFIENIQSGWEINISKFKAHFMGGCSIDEIKEGK